MGTAEGGLVNIRLTRPELATATRSAGVRLPFPLSDDVPAGSATAPDELGPALRALAAPRLVVYTVLHDDLTGTTLRVAAVEARDRATGNYAFEATTTRAAVYDVDPGGLVQTVVRAAADAGTLTDDALLGRERVIPNRDLATGPGFDPGRPRKSGVVGVLDFAGDRPRHSRSVTWRLYRNGGTLAVELPTRLSREPAVTVQAPSERNLTRACLDLITSVNHASSREGRHG